MSAIPSAGNGFAADLLERGAGGYAGFAASLMLERTPDAADELGSAALGTWRSHLTQRVLELAAAVASGEKRLFTGRVAWSRAAFRARGRSEAGLAASLKALRDVLAERLPAPASREALAWLDESLAALAGPAPAQDRSALDPSRPTDRLALRYLQQVLEGNVAEAIAGVAAAAREHGARSAYLEVLLPAQREVGRLWHLGELTVAEEHMVTSATLRSMSVIASNSPAAPSNGRTVIVAAVAGNVHDVGLRALADLFQLAGWRPIFVGADVPLQDLPTLLAYFEADLLMLGATLATHVPRVEQAIAAIRDRCERPVKIVVGGAAFDEAPDLWKRIGADAYSATLDGAIEIGATL